MTSVPDRPLDLTTLVQGLGDAVVAADAGGRIVLANAAAGRLIGTAPSDLVGRPVTSLIPPRLRSAHLTAFGRFVATGKGRLVDQAPIQVRALRADGTEVDVDLALGAVGAPGDPGFVVVASLRDVADRVFLEHQVRAVRYLEAAIDVAAGLQSAGTIDEAYATVLPTLCSHLDWDVAGLWLVDDDQQRLT
ncbi:MAG: PAS domain S-box protein, partial [Acidimicrobiales bacterium]